MAGPMMEFIQRLFTDVRALPRSIFVLIGGQFLNRFGSFVLPFLTLFLSRRGFDLGHVAIVLAAMNAGSLFGPFVSGYLADAIGRRNTIVLSLTTSGISMLGLYWCTTLPQFMLVAAVHGFCSFLFGPAANALLTDLVTKEQRVLTFALMRLAVNAGFAAGPAVAGLLFAQAPILIFIGDAATTLAFAILAFAWLPHGLRTITGRVATWDVAWQSWRDALRDIWRNPRFLQFLAATLFMCVGFVQVFNVLAVASTDRGLSPAAYGVVMGFNGFLIMILELPLNQWLRRFNIRRILVVGYALTALGCASFGFAQSFVAFLGAMALFTLGEMLSLPVGSSYVSGLAPVHYRGRYFGVSGTVWAFAGLVGSSGLWFYGMLGAPWWLLAGAVGLFGAALMSPRVKRASASENDFD